MRALVKKHSKAGLWLEDVAKPEPKPGEILIKISKTAICGTDLHIYQWDEWAKRTIKVPLVVGHEFSGVVEEVASGVKGFQIGDRVSGEGHITCSHCRNCRAGKRHLCRNTEGIGIHRHGAFAEYMTLPASNAFKLGPEVSDELGSIFDPYGNAVHTAISFDLVGEDVLITGAGPIGIMAASVARHVGARHVVITDVNDYRLALAEKMGATRVVNVKETTIEQTMHELGMTEGFDVGLEVSGNQAAFQDMLKTMNHGGRIALLGIFPEEVAIDWSLVVFKGLFIKGIYGREMFETWYKMASLVQSGLNLAPIITHRFPAREFEQAFALIKQGHTGKVILDWSEG